MVGWPQRYTLGNTYVNKLGKAAAIGDGNRLIMPLFRHGFAWTPWEADGGLFQLHQQIVGADRIHWLDVDRLDHAVPGGSDALLHLHGFQHAEFVAGGDAGSGSDHDRYDAAGHWGDDGAFGKTGGGAPWAGWGNEPWGGPSTSCGGSRGRRYDRYRFNLYLKGLAVDCDFDGRCGQVADFNGIPLSADLNSEDGYRQPPLLMDRARNWSRRPAARQALVTLRGP